MTEELTGQTGVSAEPTATGAGSAVAPGEARIAADGQPIAAPQTTVDLTQLPDFRKYQAGVDRDKALSRQQIQALQAQLAEFQKQQAELAQQFDAARLQGVDPEEAVQILQEQLAKERQAAQRAQQEQNVANELSQRASNMLASLGLDWDSPGLDLSGGSTPAGYQALLESAVKVAGEKLGAATQQGAETAAEIALRATQAAQVEVARATGATLVDTSAGPGAADGDPFGGETDPSKRLSIALGLGKKK